MFLHKDYSNVYWSICIPEMLILDCKKRPNTNSICNNVSEPPKTSTKSCTYLWGATGEQEWTPVLTTGIFFIDVNWFRI